MSWIDQLANYNHIIWRNFMLFQLYSDHAVMQIVGWVLAFCGLILMNEIGRKTKIGGMTVPQWESTLIQELRAL